MNTYSFNPKTITLAILLAATSFTANAVNLSVGATVALDGTTVSAEPQLEGTVLVDETIPFTLDGITGHVQQRVVKSSKDGTIDFYWRVFNDRTSRAPLGSLRVADFLAPEYNANWRIDGLGDIQPDQAKRLSWGNVNFVFSNGLAPGKESKFFFLDTTAVDYAKEAVFDLTGTGSGNISKSFAAYTPVFKRSHEQPTQTPTAPNNCPIATYDNGKLNIPLLTVADPFVGVVYYNVDLQQTQNRPLTFEVIKVTPVAQ